MTPDDAPGATSDWPDWSAYADHPVAFAREVLGSRLTDDQIAVIRSVQEHRITVVPSANSVGKTYVGADIALWWFLTKRPSKVITASAPPEDNLRVLLWGEINSRCHNRPDLMPSNVVRDLLIQRDPEWWLRGFTIPMSQQPHQRQARFGGKHSLWLLTIIDEGDGVPPEIYRATEQNMSGDNDRLVVFFNPKQPAGYIWQLVKGGQANVIHLSALNHPNVTGGKTIVPGAVTRRVTVERIQKWSRAVVGGEGEPSGFGADPKNDDGLFTVPDYLDGETSKRPDGSRLPPLVGGEMRRIIDPALSYMTLGIYPTGAYNQLIDRQWIIAAQNRWKLRREIYGDQPPVDIRPRSGQDVAEFGDDLNVIVDRYGGWVAPITNIWVHVDPTESATRGAEHARALGSELHCVDGNGIGASVAPDMRRQGIRQAAGIKTQQKPTKEPEELDAEFRIVRDQLAWAVREWLRTDPTAMLPDLPELEDDLLAHSYEVAGRTIRVSPKDKVKEIIGRSPDYFDALCLTFGEPEMDERMPMPAAPVRSAKRPDAERKPREQRRRGIGGGLSGKLG